MNSEGNQVEQALRDSHARLAWIADSAMDAIITVDSEQRILLFNRAAEKCSAAAPLTLSANRLNPSSVIAFGRFSCHTLKRGQTDHD